MMSLANHIEYEEKVINQLKNQFSSDANLNNFRTHYRWKHDGVSYEFDLVVLDNNNQIEKVYEIKTPKAVRTNINFIKKILHQYKNATKADVYLVYLGEDDNQLRIIPLTDLSIESPKNDSKKFYVKSFSEFYDALLRRHATMIMRN